MNYEAFWLFWIFLFVAGISCEISMIRRKINTTNDYLHWICKYIELKVEKENGPKD